MGRVSAQGIEELPAWRASRAVLNVLTLRGATAVAGIVVAGTLSRHLGPDAFGELSLVFTVAIIASSIGELGSTHVVVGEMAARPERRAELAAGYATLRAATGIVVAASGAVLLSVLLDRGTAERAGAAVMATIPLAGITSLVVLTQARLRPEVGAALSLGQSCLWLVAVVLGAVLGAPLAFYGVAFLVCAAAHAATTWLVVVRREHPAWRRWRPALGWILRRGWPLAAAAVLGTLYYRLDGVLVFALAGPAEAAYYSAAYRFLDVSQLAPAALSAVFLPLAARRWAVGDTAGLTSVLRLALKVTVAVAIPVALAGVIVGPRVGAAMFGAEFRHAGDVIAVLGLAFFSIATGYVYSGVLVSTGELRVLGGVSAVAVLGAVTADLLVIPVWGAIGAAWVTVAVEYFVSTSLALYIRRRHGLPFPWDRVGRGTAAAGAMGLVLWLVQPAPLPLVLLAGGATYVAAALRLGVVTREDLRVVADRPRALGAL